MKVVLDSNVVLSGFFFGGVPGRILEAWNAGLIEVLNSEFVDAPDYLGEAVCADPDDDKFLACALASRIRLIVSGDERLLEVSGWQGIEVIKPRAFVDRYLSDWKGGA